MFKKGQRHINVRHLATDMLVSALTFYVSLFLRVNTDEAQKFLPSLFSLLPYVVLCRAIFFVYFETYNIIWRYVSAVDAFRLAKSIAASTVAVIAISYIFQIGYVPRSLYFIDAAILLITLTSLRLARRLFHEYQNSQVLKKFGEKTLIYGAGSTGQGLLKRILGDESLKLCVIGFIDDDQTKIGRQISGYRVFGGIQDLADLVRDYEVKHVVIGVPHPSSEFLSRALSECSKVGIKPLLLSGEGQEAKAELRSVELKDLLRRDPHNIDIHSTREMLKGKRVLVTGAGGSIGSEVVRQVLSFDPSRLVIVDHSEYNLYVIDQELRQSESYIEKIVPALVDVRDRHSLKDLFEKYQPEVVIHAAAYKHVHLVEANPYSAIINNIEGTSNLLNYCENFGVDVFVLVSTDKAVNPAGVMGATKRICEMMTSFAAQRTGRVFCSVRFGNVLGSSGSLIPLLKKQIENNLPLTITHKDMTRYFMLIDEAVSLVLKAASISKPGDINVLKMGDPVKIIEVAQNLVRLMGKSLDDVEIKFTGLRPGEKMFEELYISGNELNTEHPSVLVLPRGDALSAQLSDGVFQKDIQDMIAAAQKSDREAIVILNKLVNSNYEHPTLEGQFKLVRMTSKRTPDN